MSAAIARSLSLSARDRNALAGHPPGLVGRQKHRDPGDVLRLAQLPMGKEKPNALAESALKPAAAKPSVLGANSSLGCPASFALHSYNGGGV